MTERITVGQRDARCPESADEANFLKTTRVREAGKSKAAIRARHIGIFLIISILIIVIIILAVKKGPEYPFCHPPVAFACPDFWIGYYGKCFYVSKEEMNWDTSAKTCSSFNASLAMIATQKELDFWVEFSGTSHYWLGLSREGTKVWKWPNDTEFGNQFPVRGEGFCAYIDEKGVSSTICSMEKYFLCSKPEFALPGVSCDLKEHCQVWLGG